jgi:twitching motility protein PilJ
LEQAIAVSELKGVWPQVQQDLAQNRSSIISSEGSYWAYQKVPSTNWAILAKVPHSSVSGPAYLITAGGAAIAILALGGVVLLFSRRLNRRLQPILDECYKIAGTTNNTQDLLQKQDEIDQVSTAFFNLLETQDRSTKQLETQKEILTGLARNEALIQGDAKSAAQSLTEAAAVILGIERASIWLYNPDKSAIECFDLYQRTRSEHSAGVELKAVDFPEYFKTLKEKLLIAATDARNHPSTRELSSSYFMPLGIASVLDVPIQVGGRTVGLLWCEHVAQTTKEWTLQEQSFATSLANLMSLALENQMTQSEVGHLLDIVSSVEEGDLQVRARVSDRPTGLVADTLNRSIEELVAVLSQVLNTAQQVSQGANNLEQIATTVATNAESQAQSVSRVLNLSEQVKQSTQDTDAQVQETNQSLGALSAAVGEGKTAIASLSQGIDVLQQGTDRIIQQMKTLGEFVGLADQFVQEQSQIASMTQILSMNAALVAARAAEQRNPKQFANVAREFESIAGQVSKLAQQTNDGLSMLEQRTGQIHNVVSGIDREVQSLGGLVSSFNQGVEQSERVFQNVQSVASESLEAGKAIASSSQEIANISQSTSSALQDVAQLAQKTAQLTQNTRSQSSAIGALSAQLLQRIKFFQLPASALPQPEAEAAIDSELTEDIFADGSVPVTAQNR